MQIFSALPPQRRREDKRIILFVEREWIKPGCLLCGMGALNVPDEMVMDPATKLVVDYTGLYETWAEEYPYPTFDTWFLIGSKFTDMIHDKNWTFSGWRIWEQS